MPTLLRKSWPREIADEEAIARGIFYSYHIDKKGRLKPEAYRSPPGKDEVSVMRSDWIGAHVCKHRSKKLEDKSQNKTYKGLAVLSAKQVAQTGAWLMDTQEEFPRPCGPQTWHYPPKR